jgi:4-amino-4-deoxy-L-arabinose transferase-like glycosyltransferase
MTPRSRKRKPHLMTAPLDIVPASSGARRPGLAAWARTPAGGLTILIIASCAARLLFAGSIGLGIDESYMVAAGRHWQLSYFDHPPVAWWLAWGAAHLAGSEAAIVVRLPFILLFALATVLMYRLTAGLFGERAGLSAAAVLNAAPVLGVTSATWVLPDGPLTAALLGAALCLTRAVPAAGRAAWGWWLATGACAGLALSSKYSAVLTIAGAILFLLSEPAGRRWLLRPQPYAAGIAALILFLPALIWNARHGWVSFLFQGGRAGGHFHPFGPVAAIGGAALYFLPWIWLPLVLCGVGALRRGPADRNHWLLLCLAAPPILLFTAISLWSRILFHWTAPGYLMLVPLLGEAIARHWPTSRGLRRAAVATGLFVVLGTAVVASEVRFDWLAGLFPRRLAAQDPAMAAVDWTSLRTDLAERGLLDRPRLVVAATRWLDAGKIDYALGGRVPVLCLGPDPREYGIIAPLADHAGSDVVIVAPRSSVAEIRARYGKLFRSIEVLPPALVLHAGRPALTLPLYLGVGLRRVSGGTAGSP